MNKIVIDGKEYNIDIDKAIKNGYLKPVVNRRVGQFYKHNGDDYGGESFYVLAQIGPSTVALISLASHGYGNRFTEPVSVHAPRNISDDEWYKISENNFKLVTVPFSIDVEV